MLAAVGRAEKPAVKPGCDVAGHFQNWADYVVETLTIFKNVYTVQTCPLKMSFGSPKTR